LHTKSAGTSDPQMGWAEGRSPFAGGTGCPPISLFITPFLARKEAGGMVESDARHAAWVLKSWGFKCKANQGGGLKPYPGIAWGRLSKRIETPILISGKPRSLKLHTVALGLLNAHTEAIGSGTGLHYPGRSPGAGRAGINTG
jgi:hypothetical protein